jgi:hypothetical protein
MEAAPHDDAWESPKEHPMRREQLTLYAMALAVLIVGVVYAGVPIGTLVVLPLILACPLMMIFMMRGMGGMNRGNHQPPVKREDSPEHHDSTGR